MHVITNFSTYPINVFHEIQCGVILYPYFDILFDVLNKIVELKKIKFIRFIRAQKIFQFSELMKMVKNIFYTVTTNYTYTYYEL